MIDFTRTRAVAKEIATAIQRPVSVSGPYIWIAGDPDDEEFGATDEMMDYFRNEMGLRLIQP